MMRKRLNTIVCAAVALWAVHGAAGQADYVLRQRIDGSLRDLGALSGDAFRGLTFYPKDVRDACLELAQYPALIVRLNEGMERGGFAPDRVLVNAPVSVRAAARVLAQSPDVLRVLEEDLLITGVLGRVYADDPVGVLRILDQFAAEAELSAARSVDAWADALARDAAAMDELIRAAEDYARETTATSTTVSVSVGVSSGYGFRIEATRDIDVYYTPSYEETRYILFHADRYPHLADEIILHYQVHHDDCMDDFRHAFNDWYQVRARFYPDDFFHWQGRAERLRQAALFERRFAAAYKGRAATAAARAEFLQQHVRDYPTLRVFRDPSTAPDARTAFTALPRPPEERLGAVRRGGDDRSAPGQPPGRFDPGRTPREPGKGKSGVSENRGGRPADGGAERTGRVTRKQPDRDERLRRAGKNHRSVWDPSRRTSKSRVSDKDDR